MNRLQAKESIEEFLSRSDAYPHPVTEDVQVCETHISRVFLAGPFAYKQKKPVSFGFVDYSTVEMRRFFCEEEIRLNRRLAPDVYVEVLAITETDGRFRIQRPDECRSTPVDYLVKMQRIASSDLLPARLKEGKFSAEQLDQLVDRLVRFYEGARRGPELDEFGKPEAVRRNIEGVLEHTARVAEEYCSIPRSEAVKSTLLGFLELHRELFFRRISDGRICDGHGDLRAEHIAFLPGPRVIDCVEFSENFRIGDVAADIAFLYMDLEFLGQRRFARQLIERFVERTGDDGFSRLLHFYASYRALVRAKVDTLRLGQPGLEPSERVLLEQRARRYLELAYYHAIQLDKPICLLVGGLSGTGKSTLARCLSDRLGYPHLRSDEFRGRLADEEGLSRSGDFGSGAYSPDFTRRTYSALQIGAKSLLEEGSSVIVDATFSTADERALFLDLCHATGARFVHLECRVDRETAAERMIQRRRVGKDPSRAGPEIQKEQERLFESSSNAVVIETLDGPEKVCDRAIEHLKTATGQSSRGLL